MRKKILFLGLACVSVAGATVLLNRLSTHPNDPRVVRPSEAEQEGLSVPTQSDNRGDLAGGAINPAADRGF